MTDILKDAPPAVQKLFYGMWADIQRMENDRAEREAKANPEKHRNCRVFENSSYRYYEAKNGRGSRVRFCYSTHRNVAGYYLVWREVVTKKQAKRDQWDSTKLKDDAILVCRKRWEAARATV